MTTTRRDLLKLMTATAALALTGCAHASPPPEAPRASTSSAHARTGAIPRRRFGRTDIQVSAIGIGGWHLGDAPDEGEAIRIVHEAIDAGIDFFDNA